MSTPGVVEESHREAKKFGKVNEVASSADKNFTYAPAFDTWKCDPNAAYLHYTPNETIAAWSSTGCPN